MTEKEILSLQAELLQIEKEVNSGYSIVTEHVKIESEDLKTSYADGVIIHDFEIANITENGENKEYVVCVNNTDNIYFLGNNILLNILKKIDEKGYRSVMEEGLLKFTFEDTRSTSSKRIYRKWSAVANPPSVEKPKA